MVITIPSTNKKIIPPSTKKTTLFYHTNFIGIISKLIFGTNNSEHIKYEVEQPNPTFLGHPQCIVLVKIMSYYGNAFSLL